MTTLGRRKIAVFSPFLNPVGVKRATFALGQEFSKNGYDVDMLSVHREWEGLEFLNNMKLTYLSTKFKDVPTQGYFVFRAISFLLALRTLFTLSSYLKSKSPNILFVSMMPTLAWCCLKLSGKLSDTNFVVSIQGFPRNNLFRRLIWKKVLRDSVDVIAESEDLKKKIKKMTGLTENFSSIYNPHFENQNEIKVEEKFTNPAFSYILGLGRLTKQKNFSLLIRAFSLLDEQKDLQLIIIGDGEERSKLETLSRKLKIDNKVKFLGNLDQPLGYLESAEMLVIPSLWEGLPRVAVEAQALRTPIISACSVGGLGEILLDGEAGIITKPNDPDDMKNGIEKYLDNKEMARNHSELAYINLARFSVKKSAGEYLARFSRY